MMDNRRMAWVVIVGLCFSLPAFPQLKTAPRTSSEWNSLGVELSQNGRQREAVEAFTRVIEIKPGDPTAYLNRAIAHIRLEEWKKAEADCSSAIELDSDNARSFHHRAVARSQMGEHESAFKDASRAARMEPTDPNVIFTRYLACSRLGRHDLGHFAGETYVGLQSWSDPWSPYFALLNSISLRRAGYQEEALAILKESARWLDHDAWPMPVVIYLRGDMDAPKLFDLAKDTDMLTIVHYYVGVDEWLGGNATSARKHFEWVRDQGNKEFLQYLLAKDHLMELASAGSSQE